MKLDLIKWLTENSKTSIYNKRNELEQTTGIQGVCCSYVVNKKLITAPPCLILTLGTVRAPILRQAACILALNHSVLYKPIAVF